MGGDRRRLVGKLIGSRDTQIEAGDWIPRINLACRGFLDLMEMPKLSFFKLAFIMYMVVSSVVAIMCIVFLFLDGSDNGKTKAIYASIVTFLVGSWTNFLSTHNAKSRTKELRKALQPQAFDANSMSPARPAGSL